jgi:aspartate dehydrogenase
MAMKLALVGFGAIGRELARLLQGDGAVEIVQIVVPPRSVNAALRAAAELGYAARVLEALNLTLPLRPDLVVECAGHAAVMSHVVAALRAGVPCVAASLGALHEADSLGRLEDAARTGCTRLQLVSGAVGGIDALAGARLGGLDRVTYIGRKPPRGWLGTPAEQVCDLASLTAPCVVFRGSAREAARQFPKNANVAATIALAGLGMDRTEVDLVADPGIERNVHRLEASGAFGHFEMQLENRPLPTNPKTSALTVYSLARAVRNAGAAVFI